MYIKQDILCTFGILPVIIAYNPINKRIPPTVLFYYILFIFVCQLALCIKGSRNRADFLYALCFSIVFFNHIPKAVDLNKDM